MRPTETFPAGSSRDNFCQGLNLEGLRVGNKIFAGAIEMCPLGTVVKELKIKVCKFCNKKKEEDVKYLLHHSNRSAGVTNMVGWWLLNLKYMSKVSKISVEFGKMVGWVSSNSQSLWKNLEITAEGLWLFGHINQYQFRMKNQDITLICDMADFCRNIYLQTLPSVPMHSASWLSNLPSVGYQYTLKYWVHRVNIPYAYHIVFISQNIQLWRNAS